MDQRYNTLFLYALYLVYLLVFSLFCFGLFFPLSEKVWKKQITMAIIYNLITSHCIIQIEVDATEIPPTVLLLSSFLFFKLLIVHISTSKLTDNKSYHRCHFLMSCFSHTPEVLQCFGFTFPTGSCTSVHAQVLRRTVWISVLWW